MDHEKNGRVVVTALGGPEVLQYIEEAMPTPGPGQVRVRILAAGVSYADVLMRRGLYPDTPRPPFSPGYDIVGDVDATGDGVTAFSSGQRVGAMIVRGGYSRFVVVAEEYLVPVPAEVDPAEAVCMFLNYVTAYQMLHRVAHAVKPQRVLIHGGAGGVGTALLQLGGIEGLTMFATASKSKQQFVASHGAVAIDYRSENFPQRVRELTSDGVDVVFDAVGGMNWWQSYRLLRKKGILVCYGLSAAVTGGKLVGALSFLLMGILSAIPDGKKCVWYIITGLRKQHPDWFREDLTILFRLLASRKLQPVVAARLPLSEATQANQLIEQSKVIGKIVLLCQQ
jgi:NADPH2:quinone reductase